MKAKLNCGCEIEIRNETIKECDGLPSLHIDFDNINLNCKRTWSLFNRGDTKGIFQLEKNLGQQWSKRVQPTNIEEAAALISLIRPGCVSCDTQIMIKCYKKNHGRCFTKLSIKELYKKFHKNHFHYRKHIVSLNEKKNIYFDNIIDNIVYTGKKKVYKPLFSMVNRKEYISNSYNLECTLDHKLLVHKKGWTELKNLQIGDKVAVINFSNKKSKHRNLHIGERNFNNICFQNYEYMCVFCDWKDGSLDVNHLEGSRKTNNHIDNLCYLCPNHHRMYSEGNISKEQVIKTRKKYKLNNTKDILWVEYKGKKSLGIKDVYDIKVNGPNHNFIAGNVVVHNCLEAKDKHGKSMAENYVDRRNGIEPKYDKEEQSICNKLESILGNTHNIIVYQEQAMKIAVEIGGFNGQEADVLRKAIGKKKPELMKIVRENFITKCKTTGIVTDSEALAIFDIIEKSQRYSFNKCITGDTLFKKNKDKYNTNMTIEEMFLVRNCKVYAYKTNHHDLHKKWKRLGNYGRAYSLCEDGRIRPNTIKDIRFIGIHPVYNIITSSGKNIKATINHKFPTNNGIKTVKDLNIGDNLIVCGEYDNLSDKKYNWSDLKQNLNKTYENNKSGFPTGESNSGYTNGEYSKWKENKRKLMYICDICYKINVKLECHHKDGDRTNNELSNLQMLCISCHKKTEYKNGRRRKGEKGYPSYLEKIVKIEKLYKERVYDVEMEGPNHNFVINNDIITCNSHAVAYALMGYQAAFVKAHYPLHYICSWLYYSQNKQDEQEEVSEIVSDAKIVNVNIYPPYLTSLFTGDEGDVCIHNNNVYLGIRNIKKVGANHIKKLIYHIRLVEKQLDKPLAQWSWYEFLTQLSNKVGSAVITGIISSGGLGYMKQTRHYMLYEYQTIWNELTKKEQDYIATKIVNCETLEAALAKMIDDQQTYVLTKNKDLKSISNVNRLDKITDLLNILKKPPVSLVDSPDWIVATEHQLLGTPITISRVDTCTQDQISMTCMDFKKNITTKGNMGVEIKAFREYKITKSGKNKNKIMGFLSVEDNSCKLDSVIIFPEELKKYKNLLYEENTVLITGYKSNRDGFIVENVQQLA